MRSWNKDDIWEQVKHCLCCNEPFLMVDHIKSSSGKEYDTMRRWYGKLYESDDPVCDWKGVSKTIIYGKEYCNECVRLNRHNIQHKEEQKPLVDTQYMKELLYAVREELGLSKADTPSTFDGWETCEMACYRMRVNPRIL